MKKALILLFLGLISLVLFFGCTSSNASCSKNSDCVAFSTGGDAMTAPVIKCTILNSKPKAVVKGLTCECGSFGCNEVPKEFQCNTSLDCKPCSNIQCANAGYIKDLPLGSLPWCYGILYPIHVEKCGCSSGRCTATTARNY